MIEMGQKSAVSVGLGHLGIGMTLQTFQTSGYSLKITDFEKLILRGLQINSTFRMYSETGADSGPIAFLGWALRIFELRNPGSRAPHLLFRLTANTTAATTTTNYYISASTDIDFLPNYCIKGWA